MKNIYIIIIMSILSSCDKLEDNEIEDVSEPQTSIVFSIQSKDGTDLLNPQNAESFNHSDIGFYSDHALTKNVNDLWSSIEKNIDTGEQILIDEYTNGGEKKFVIPIHARGDVKKTETIYYSMVYLKLSETDIDTITTEVTVASSGFFNVSKFVYNDKVIFDDVNEQKKWNGVIIK